MIAIASAVANGCSGVRLLLQEKRWVVSRRVQGYFKAPDEAGQWYAMFSHHSCSSDLALVSRQEGGSTRVRAETWFQYCRLTTGQSPDTAAAAAAAGSSGCSAADGSRAEPRATWTVRTVAAQVRGATALLLGFCCTLNP